MLQTRQFGDLRVTSPAPRDLWRQLVAANPSTLPSQTPEWTDAICALGAYDDASRLYERRDGSVMVLPMVGHHLPLNDARTEHSMAPTWGTGGLLVEGGLPGVDDVRAVFADLTGDGALRTTIRPDFEQAPVWAAARPVGAIPLPAVHHVLDLDDGFDALHGRFNKMARKAIRKAEREGVVVDCDTTGAGVDTYYELYERWVARRARARRIPLRAMRWQAHRNEPRKRLDLLADLFGDGFRVWLARVDGEPIAAMITLVRGEVALAWRGTSDLDRAGPVRANDLIHRHAIEDACLSGCRYYNMGESGGVESLMKFKERFGATPRDLTGYRLERIPFTAATSRLMKLRTLAEGAALAVLSTT